MARKRQKAKPLSILLIILLPVIIFLFSFVTMVYDENFHNQENMIEYFKDTSSFAQPDIEGFTNSEKAHLLDVKIIINAVIVLFVVLLFTWLGMFYFAVDKRKIVFYGGILAVAIPILIYFIPFDFLFNAFHNLFFTQGSWLFPADSQLLQLYPVQFFKDAAFRIVGQGFIVGLMLAGFSRLKN